MDFQREPELTFHKWSQNLKYWSLKTGFCCKKCQKRPLNGLQSMPEGWEMDPQIPCPIGNHFSWGLGYFARQTKLKWTKNFKALFLSLTKYNGTVFWRFATDMLVQYCTPTFYLKSCKFLYQPTIPESRFEIPAVWFEIVQKVERMGVKNQNTRRRRDRDPS